MITQKIIGCDNDMFPEPADEDDTVTCSDDLSLPFHIHKHQIESC